MKKHASVIGDPVTHSLSPAIHKRWLRLCHVSGTYRAQQVAKEELNAFLFTWARGMPEQVGHNVTMPHKQEAFYWALQHPAVAVQPYAHMTRAVNLVFRRGDRLFADNTDAVVAQTLFADALQVRVDSRPLRVVILGAGGAARAVAIGISAFPHGAQITFVRTRKSNSPWSRDTFPLDIGLHSGATQRVLHLDALPRLLSQTDLLVNASPCGMQGYPSLDVPLWRLSREAVVADLVYRPVVTPFIKAAQAEALTTIDGLSFLLVQAAHSFESLFGVTPFLCDSLEASYRWLAKQ